MLAVASLAVAGATTSALLWSFMAGVVFGVVLSEVIIPRVVDAYIALRRRGR